MERFWSKVRKTDTCWLWTASKQNKGYGQFMFQGRPHPAHRVSWMLTHGAMPELCVLHRCDNPPCVNPDHLFLGTKADNNADMAAKGRHWAQNKPRKTHCVRGHERTPENLIDGRGCRACARERQRTARAANPEHHQARDRAWYWRNLEESRRKGREKQRRRQQKKEATCG